MSHRPFPDRAAAGRVLADEVNCHLLRRPATVIGIARGGVPVAAEVARKVAGALEVIVVRKVGHPLEPELALGAVTADGTFTPSGVTAFAPDEATLRELIRAATADAAEMEHALRGPGPQRDLTGEICIVVDDGVATGASMRAALRAVRARGAAAVIAATPIISTGAQALVADDANEVMAVLVDDRLQAVGAYYDDFAPVSTAQVAELLDVSARQEVP